MKFFAAIRSTEFANKLFSAASFDFAAAHSANDADALKKYIEASNAKVLADTIKPDAALAKELSDLKAHVAEIEAENENLTAALSGIGFQIPADAATTTAALESHIKIRAQGLLAKSGHPALASAPAAAVKIDESAGPALTGRDRYLADFNRQIHTRSNRN